MVSLFALSMPDKVCKRTRIPLRLIETIMPRHQARTCKYIIDNGIGYKPVSASLFV